VGRFNGGEIAEIPNIYPGSDHPRANGKPGDWYLNFQDPTGQPTADPLLVGGHEYLKIGGSIYDATDGYGWYAPADVDWRYAWVAAAPNDLQRSVLYSNLGRTAVFEFDMPMGTYDVTVSVGWQGRSDAHGRIVVEGVPLVDDETVTDHLIRTRRVEIPDSRLTMELGIDGHYTMLNHLDIEYVGTVSGVDDQVVPAASAHRLHPAAPNPFNPRTRLAFTLATPEVVTLRVYDASGRLVRTLLDDAPYGTGTHDAVWRGRDDDGRTVAAGVYLYRLQAGPYSETKRMVLVK